MKRTIETVIEAAEIRAEQWERIGNGVPPHEVIDELYEVWGDRHEVWRDLSSDPDGVPNEAQSIAEEQNAAIAEVRDSLPLHGSCGARLDTLAINAMCIWEAALELNRGWHKHASLEEPVNHWLADGEGAFSAREGCWKLAGLADIAWGSITNEDGDPPDGLDAFDWDFIPAWLEELHRVCSDHAVRVHEVTPDHAKRAANAVLFNSGNRR